MKKFLIFGFFILNLTIAFSKDTNFYNLEFWKKLEKVDYPIVFIHGIGGGFKNWDIAATLVSNENYYEMRYLDGKGLFHNYFPENQNKSKKPWVWNVSYYTMNPLKESIEGDLTTYAKRLEEIIEKIKLITGKEKVVLIAHSMGGLVARKYMTLNDKNWDSVYKILTVGTPNIGVSTSVPIVGQLRDLGMNNSFQKDMNKVWYSKDYKKKWGVVGGVETKLWINYKNNKFATDLAGIGYVEIRSSIPNGEWKEAVRELNRAKYNTKNYGFRIAVSDNHMGLLYNKGTLEGIVWAIKK
ncbi:esterase/lipase family protein [Haliovirga abyssi]|uniref:GPI inositol-deacylase PGAP1-like alpha/beta domain-containing protein n=1 Tax=Haliovirga abyssi TaxID=2996794 RepID=A0AAU9DCD2_9FUSO|nr:alpha/beta fold hydrolase [Haliovirga abyssi]BDU49952.1 hypothetical protein HLVA_05210 [Haliovirga abyssi]